MPLADAGIRLSFAVMAESRRSFVTPEPPRTVPLATVLHGLCSPGLADDLVQTLRAIGRLAPDGAPASDVANAPPDAMNQREATESRLRSDLARAIWALGADLSARVRRGEFHLRGRLQQPGSPAALVVVPLAPSTVLSIDSEAAAITTKDGSYAEVEAVLGPAPSSPAGIEEPRSMPLWDALVSWCDPVLLCDIRRNERYFSRDELRRFGNPTLGAAEDGTSMLGHSAFQRIRERLSHLWDDLALDFKKRIELGQVHLQGVQTHPVREIERKPIPSAWATDFRFDFPAGTLAVDGYRYVSVTCSLDRPAASAAAASSSEGTISDTANVAEDVLDTAETGKAQRAVGRENSAPLIETDLRANWDGVRRQAARNPGERPVWAELARAVRKRLDKGRRDGERVKIPHVDTIRKHLPGIYERLLRDIPGQ